MIHYIVSITAETTQLPVDDDIGAAEFASTLCDPIVEVVANVGGTDSASTRIARHDDTTIITITVGVPAMNPNDAAGVAYRALAFHPNAQSVTITGVTAITEEARDRDELVDAG